MVTDLGAKQDVKRVQISATVIRADGTRENLGVISDSARWWRYGPGRVRAWWRTVKANLG